MTWPTALANQTEGVGVAEDWFDAVNLAVEHLGGLLGQNSTALKDFATGASIGIPTPDYNSGWFAASAATTHSKAHGLGAIPSHVIVEWASSSTPTTVVEYKSETSGGGADTPSIAFDATNVSVVTGSTFVINNKTYSSTGGFLRVRGWL